MSSESPSQPGKAQVGDSGQPFGRMAVDDDVRDGRPNSVDQAGPQAVEASGTLRLTGRPRPRPRRQTPSCRADRACPSARRAPARRHAGAARTRHPGAATARRRRTDRRACAPVIVIASAPESAKSTGTAPTACTASVCSGTPYSWAMSASSATGCTVPTSLFAHITLISATESACSCSSARTRVRVGPTARIAPKAR